MMVYMLELVAHCLLGLCVSRLWPSISITSIFIFYEFVVQLCRSYSCAAAEKISIDTALQRVAR